MVKTPVVPKIGLNFDRFLYINMQMFRILILFHSGHNEDFEQIHMDFCVTASNGRFISRSQ